MTDLDTLISTFQSNSNLDIIPTLYNFLICLLMGFVLRAFYVSRSFSLTGKHHIGSIIPILSGVIFLVIIVVKSSLALSLGLVGALSIVRFRTPIKEPEELVYLFLAIALGLGYGAGHVFLTTVITLIILTVIYFFLSNRQIGRNLEFNMIIDWADTEVSFNELLKELESKLLSLKLVRIDYGETNNTAVLLVVPDEHYSLDDLTKELRNKAKGLNCSFFEAKTNW